MHIDLRALEIQNYVSYSKTFDHIVTFDSIKALVDTDN